MSGKMEQVTSTHYAAIHTVEGEGTGLKEELDKFGCEYEYPSCHVGVGAGGGGVVGGGGGRGWGGGREMC